MRVTGWEVESGHPGYLTPTSPTAISLRPNVAEGTHYDQDQAAPEGRMKLVLWSLHAAKNILLTSQLYLNEELKLSSVKSLFSLF